MGKQQEHLKKRNKAVLAKNERYFIANKESIDKVIKSKRKAREYASNDYTRSDNLLGFTCLISKELADRQHRKPEKRSEIEHKELNKVIRTKTKTVYKQKRYNVFSKT